MSAEARTFTREKDYYRPAPARVNVNAELRLLCDPAFGDTELDPFEEFFPVRPEFFDADL